MPELPSAALDLPSLTTWFSDNVDGANATLLKAELVAGGRSNLTFIIRQGNLEWVLRRPPLGHVLPSAHDMVREYTVLKALQETPVPVPVVHAICTDVQVVGAPFFVMDKVDGVVLRSASDGDSLTDAQAKQISRQLVDVLARIHAVEWQEIGLSEFGRPDGYLERQLSRWGEQWQRSHTRDVPGLDELARRLAASVPRSPAPTLVHGDYRLDNVMLAMDETRAPVAVLDWEMSTIGDPLADVGLLMVYWADRDDRFAPPSVAPQVSASSMFLSRREMAEEYSLATGRDVSALPFYVVLGYFKLAIILEGIHRRFTQGQTLGAGFERLGDEVPKLVSTALDIARELSPRSS